MLVNTERNTGGRYNPITDTWVATSLINAPTKRQAHTAVWTGTEMIIWGGTNSLDGPFTYWNVGGRYNPTTDSWAATAANFVGTVTSRLDGQRNARSRWVHSGGLKPEHKVLCKCAVPTGTHARTHPKRDAVPSAAHGLAYPNRDAIFGPHIRPGDLLLQSESGPVRNVMLAVTGNMTSSTSTDGSGHYALSLPVGGTYDVTLAKTRSIRVD